MSYESDLVPGIDGGPCPTFPTGVGKGVVVDSIFCIGEEFLNQCYNLSDI